MSKQEARDLVEAWILDQAPKRRRMRDRPSNEILRALVVLLSSPQPKE